MSGIFTVGHSNYTAEYFINKMLKPFEIDTLVDVRTYPASRNNPQYNRNTLAASLYKSGIKYLYGGTYLGGIGKKCPSVHSDGFIDSMGKVVMMSEVLNVVLMCSERNPQECHRAMKLTAYLNKVYGHLDVPTPKHIVKASVIAISHGECSSLVDAYEMENHMPDGWYWHEFGGKYKA